MALKLWRLSVESLTLEKWIGGFMSNDAPLASTRGMAATRRFVADFSLPTRLRRSQRRPSLYLSSSTLKYLSIQSPECLSGAVLRVLYIRKFMRSFVT